MKNTVFLKAISKNLSFFCKIIGSFQQNGVKMYENYSFKEHSVKVGQFV